MLSSLVLILAALSSTVLTEQWANLCAGKSSNEIRMQDIYGSGHYGARRGNRRHQGVDILCSDGSTVYAPFSGMIERPARPYRQNNAINDGVRISSSDFCVKMFYIKPIKYKGFINKGEKLGTLLPMQQVYPGIKSHIHIENCDRSNPTMYL